MNCLKYLKRGTENRGGDKKILKKGGGQAGPRGGCLEKRWAGMPLQFCFQCFYGIFLFFVLQIFGLTLHQFLFPDLGSCARSQY